MISILKFNFTLTFLDKSLFVFLSDGQTSFLRFMKKSKRHTYELHQHPHASSFTHACVSDLMKNASFLTFERPWPAFSKPCCFHSFSIDLIAYRNCFSFVVCRRLEKDEKEEKRKTRSCANKNNRLSTWTVFCRLSNRTNVYVSEWVGGWIIEKVRMQIGFLSWKTCKIQWQISNEFSSESVTQHKKVCVCKGMCTHASFSIRMCW